MIDVGIRLETSIIIKDELLSKFKSFDISTNIGEISAAELDNCGNVIYRSSTVDDHFPNVFKIIAIDISTQNNIFQVIVNPSICDYTYTLSLDKLNSILNTSYSLDDINEVIADTVIKSLYL